MSRREDDARRAQEDADWQALVDGYGERPEFPEVVTPEDLAPHGGTLEPDDREPAELRPPELGYEDEDRFVPPPAPPVPRPRGLRALAWFGLFGVPTIVLLCIMVKISVPSMLGLLFLAWFIGGFGYLVATMSGPDDPDAGWDDGAVL